MIIGITGGDGFIGYHTYTYLKYATEHEVIKLDRDFGKDVRLKECDWVIHLAGMNRGDEDEIYKTNIGLTQLLLDSVKTGCNIIFSSSTQVELNNSYGKCKLECEQMIQEWCQKHSSKFYNLRIPNVFGPFCKPNYNSFVTTMCYKVCKGESVKITKDNDINLIYVKDVVEQFKNCIYNDKFQFNSKTMSIKQILKKLQFYKDVYFSEVKIPNLNDDFDRNLFNTFISYLNNEDRLLSTELHKDERGSLSELLRCDSSEGQLFFSTFIFLKFTSVINFINCFLNI